MLDHISIGVRDLKRSAAFYDAALAPLGLRRLMEFPEAIGYGAEHPFFWIGAPKRPLSPPKGSGLHICLRAPSRAAVDAFHKAALAKGAVDDGAPGLRPEYSPAYYAAFVLDPDGYKIEAVCRAPQ